MRYYKEHNRQFEWMYEADNFMRKVKATAKALHLNLIIKILPIIRFSSSSTQRWSWLDRLRGEKKAETRIVGYIVRWAYKP